MKVGSGDITVMTQEGVIAARYYKRRPKEERRNLEQMNGVTGSAWEPAPGPGRIEFKSTIGIRD